MAQDGYHHGVSLNEISGGSRYLQTFRTGVIGMVGTAVDADPEVFPENVPVLVINVKTVSGKAGDQGTLAPELDAISAQGSPIGVFIRVPEGESDAETTSNLIGKVTDNQQYTGLNALLAAQSILGVTPRVLGVPQLDNQSVVTKLVEIAQKLRAFVYAHCEGENISEMLNYRKQFGARELMLIAPNFLQWSTSANASQSVAATAFALGLRAKIDSETGWHKSLSNVAVGGAEGIDKDISWNLQSPDTDAGLLNEAGITTLINYNGYRFWGSRTCADDGLFYFEPTTRAAQIIADTIAENMFSFVDGVMIPNNARDIIESVNAKLREWVRLGYLLGGECWYDPEANTKEKLKNGIIEFDYDYTAAPRWKTHALTSVSPTSILPISTRQYCNRSDKESLCLHYRIN